MRARGRILLMTRDHPLSTRRNWLAAGASLAAAGLWPSAPQAQARSGSSVAGDERARSLPALGDPFELADAPLLDGSSFRADEMKDRLVLLYWWASWCPFCAQTSPHIDALWRQWRPRGLYVLGISLDRSADIARRHLQSRGYIFASTLQSAAPAPLVKPKGLPVTLGRGRSGRIVFAESGELFAQDLEILEKHL